MVVGATSCFVFMYCGSMGVQVQTLEEFLKYHDLYQLYLLARKYLPTLPDPRDVYVAPWECSPCRYLDTALGCTWKVDGKLYVSFREHIPSIFVILHEFIHLAGGGEWEAYNYLPALWYAIRTEMPPFNLLKLREVDMETLDMISRRLFGVPVLKLVVDYMAVIPPCTELYTDGDIIVKFREGLSEHEKAQCLLAVIISGLETGNWIAIRFFEELVKMLH